MQAASIAGVVVNYTRFGRPFKHVKSAIRALKRLRNAYVIDDSNRMVADRLGHAVRLSYPSVPTS
jgi:hypothetical protein